jgi:hypothetical protein
MAIFSVRNMLFWICEPCQKNWLWFHTNPSKLEKNVHMYVSLFFKRLINLLLPFKGQCYLFLHILTFAFYKCTDQTLKKWIEWRHYVTKITIACISIPLNVNHASIHILIVLQLFTSFCIVFNFWQVSIKKGFWKKNHRKHEIHEVRSR